MNGRRRGTREKSRKQALDSVWSMEMSRLMRDGTAEPVSGDQILRRERGQLFGGTLVFGLILRSLWGLHKMHETL